MKLVNVTGGFLLLFLVAGCGTGDEAVRPSAADGAGQGGVTTLVAEHPEKLREVVMDLIGEGPESEAAIGIIDRYESDLRFVLDGSSATTTVADSAAASEVSLSTGTGIVGGAASVQKTTAIPSSPADRVRRFVQNSLSVAMIGLNECYENYDKTKDPRFAMRGLAHGYIALISDPSHKQRSTVVDKMKVLQEHRLK